MTTTRRVLALGIALAAAQAMAGGAAAPADGPPSRRLPAKVTFHKAPSEESPAERARRMRRECKGRPNAGACLGFATP